jgi:apolipoprotein N-acyltransferase
MRKQLPIFLVFLSGVIMVLQYFVPHHYSEELFAYANDFVIVIGILALPIGIFSLIHGTALKAQRDKSERFYALAMLAGFAVMVLSGLKREWFINPHGLNGNLFQYVLNPAQSSLFAMLAFYIASAAYRAFRVRTALAAVLLLTAFVVMLRIVPLPGTLSEANGWLVRQILAIPNLASKRAIIIGVALGGIAYSMKILLGIERSYLGRD